jgi:preprotein translocase subunit SecF
VVVSATEGSHSGPIWQAVVFLCGILPSIFVATGLLIWLRSRRANAVDRGVSGVPQIDAAE